MSTLISKLAGGELAGFILVLARVAPLFVVAPLFSSKALPAQVRTVIAVGISIGLAPVALQGQHIPSSAIALGELVIEGLLCGLGFAFTLAVLLAALESASAFVDFVSGLSFGNLVNPALGTQGGAFSELYGMLGLFIFLTIDGEEWMLRGIARTFKLVPLTSAPRVGSLVGGAENAFATIFASAVELVAPILLTLLVTDVAFGVLSRVVPQMNIFAVGFSVKIGVAILVVAATLPFVAGWLSEQITISVGAALGSLHAV